MGRCLRSAAPLVLLVAVAATACGDDGPSTASSRSGAAGFSSVSGGITVFAAASLTDAFTEIGEVFEQANPDTKVTFNFGASSALAQQINEGAPADIFASADAANMKKLTDAAGTKGEPEAFASNRLEIITGPGNPEGIETLEDLADPAVIFVTCGPDVPIGRYTAEVFEKAGVDATPKSYETDVKGIVTKVTLGEADAGIVYATDVKAAGAKATGITIPDEVNVIARYPIAVTRESTNIDVSEAFVAFVLSDEGQAILADFGFSEP